MIKNKFKYDSLTNQYKLNYKGKWIYIDFEDFKKMSDDDVLEMIKNLTKPKEKKKTDYVSYDELKKGFDDVREYIKTNPNIDFKTFMRLRKS